MAHVKQKDTSWASQGCLDEDEQLQQKEKKRKQKWYNNA